MGKMKNGFILFEPEQHPDFSKSYKKRYEILVDCLNEGMKKERALMYFEAKDIFFDSQENYEKYFKKLKEKLK